MNQQFKTDTILSNYMFAVVYNFEVKDKREEEFINHWGDLTNLIYNHCGSYGSRLHKGRTGNFMAYALWPSKDLFEAANSKLPYKAKLISDNMKSCCLKITSPIEGEMVMDLIKDNVANEQQ